MCSRKSQIPPETPCVYPIRFLKLAGDSKKYASVLYEYVAICVSKWITSKSLPRNSTFLVKRRRMLQISCVSVERRCGKMYFPLCHFVSFQSDVRNSFEWVRPWCREGESEISSNHWFAIRKLQRLSVQRLRRKITAFIKWIQCWTLCVYCHVINCLQSL